jgi:rhodanese-related sulfurtransferase
MEQPKGVLRDRCILHQACALARISVGRGAIIRVPGRFALLPVLRGAVIIRAFLKEQPRMKKILIALVASLSLLVAPAHADENPAVVDALSGYLDFAEYGSSLIWPEQIPKEDWKKVFIVDARDAAQYAKEHIPGAVNIDWRQAVARRAELPKDRMVVMYCNSGSLSAQAVFALRLLGYENVKVLQDGIEGWKAKGGFEAHARASQPAGH